jgi:hypothetical protein
VVEGLPEVVNHVADDQREDFVVRVGEDPHAQDVLMGLDLAFLNDQACVTFGPSLLGRVERIQVFERPVEL